jgi:hypothetical protein
MTLNLDNTVLAEIVGTSAGSPHIDRRTNATLRRVVREVSSSHAGQPREIVDAHLRRRFADNHASPKEPRFSEVVDAISQGTLRS